MKQSQLEQKAKKLSRYDFNTLDVLSQAIDDALLTRYMVQGKIDQKYYDWLKVIEMAKAVKKI